MKSLKVSRLGFSFEVSLPARFVADCVSQWTSEGYLVEVKS